MLIIGNGVELGGYNIRGLIAANIGGIIAGDE